MQEGFVGRQPIYKDGVDLFAYELFSHNNELKQSAFANGDTVTAEALLHECLGVGLAEVTGKHPAFVNASREFILNDYSWFLPKEGVFIQIAGDVKPDDAVLKAASHLKNAGYSIALKDFVYRDDNRPLTEIADIVKVNVRSDKRDLLAKQFDKIRSLGVKVLAQGVETHEEYQAAKNLGADYFEGYFFCKPNPRENTTIRHNRLSTLQLLATLQTPDVTLEQVEQTLGQDMAMSHKILRYVNTPMNPSPRKVDSIRHAISLVGTNLIRQWAAVIWLDSLEEKPRELMVMATIRAHMCQQLGIALGGENGDQFFTAGLLSLLDALMDRPMDAILGELPLIDPVKEALLNRNGAMGEAIRCVEAYERCDWAQTRCGNLSEKTIREAYLTGVLWTRATLNELAN
jgi:EAL and modified HD-GYP domain-containing signal transduction protein